MKKLFLIIPIIALAGCASDYNRYVDAQIAIQTVHSNAEAEKYKAMAEIAKTGDTTTKVVAMMSLQGQGQSTQSTQLAAPRSQVDTLMQALGIFVPAIVQGYGIHSNQIVSTTASNNATALGISTNQAFVGMAGQIQAPAANVTTNTDSHAISNSYNPTDNSNQGNPVDNSNQNNVPTPIVISN